MATIINKLKKQQIKEGMNKSQPNLLKAKSSSQQKLKSIALKNDRNIKAITTLARRKSQPVSASPGHKEKKHRPSSSLHNLKKTIEDYNTTHTSTCSRQPFPSSINHHKSTGVLLFPKAYDNPYQEQQIQDLSLIDKSFCKTYERFTKQRIDSVNRLSGLKKAIEDKERSAIRSIPSINQKSKELCKSSGDFLTRMRRSEESVSKKKEKMIKVKQKKEFAEYNCYKKARANNSIDVDINNRIQKLFEWDSTRKKRLETMKENVIMNEQSISTQRHQIKGNKNNSSVINRLYKEDPIRIKAKKVLLMKALTPSFEPRINTSRNSKFKFNADKIKEIQLDYLSVKTENLLRERIIYNKNKQPAEV